MVMVLLIMFIMARIMMIKKKWKGNVHSVIYLGVSFSKVYLYFEKE